MTERDMEDLIAAYPDDFFPHKGFQLKGRQQSFAGVGRFDLLFTDRFDTNILMELKAVPAKYEVATQLAKYRDELLIRGEKHVLMWLIAPSISNSVREFLDRIGIEYTEIHEAEFRNVAERNGVAPPLDTKPKQVAPNVEADADRPEPKREPGGTVPDAQAQIASRMIHNNFRDLMESTVVPHHAANPAQIRLDGRTTGPNGKVAFRFRHHGKVWGINFDTHYDQAGRLLRPIHRRTDQHRDGNPPQIAAGIQEHVHLPVKEEAKRLTTSRTRPGFKVKSCR
jgi:hypothetical protein